MSEQYTASLFYHEYHTLDHLLLCAISTTKYVQSCFIQKDFQRIMLSVYKHSFIVYSIYYEVYI